MYVKGFKKKKLLCQVIPSLLVLRMESVWIQKKSRLVSPKTHPTMGVPGITVVLYIKK
jgi:hypothetical protein